MGYLEERAELQMVFLLVDGVIGPTELDLLMLENLQAIGVAHTIVATKQDKVGSSKRESRRRDLAAGCEVGESDVVWVSASTGAGIERLRSIVNACLVGNTNRH